MIRTARGSRPAVAIRAVALAVVAWTLCVWPATAQRPTVEVDPYTRGDAEAWAAAGYLASAPFAWAGKHDTEDVEDVLGVPLRWVETAHFRIGSSLPAIRVGNAERDAVRAELKRLGERLPRVKSNTRELDPWLRLHLYAQRVEELHADLCRRLGVTDADFPAEFDGDFAPPAGGGRYTGEGPHLGMPGKFTLLLLHKRTSLGRYRDRFTSQTEDTVVRGAWFEPLGMSVAVSTELREQGWSRQADEPLPDAALHAHVAFHVSHSLVYGYGYYWYLLPFWLPEGVAHHYRRQADPRWNHFSWIETQEYRAEEGEPSWPARVRARVQHEYFPAADELMAWQDGTGRELADHMMIWSRIDYMFARPTQDFASFFAQVKDHPRTEDWRLGYEQLLERQSQALQAAFGFDEAGFDAAWSEWVLDTYPRK